MLIVLFHSLSVPFWVIKSFSVCVWEQNHCFNMCISLSPYILHFSSTVQFRFGLICVFVGRKMHKRHACLEILLSQFQPVYMRSRTVLCADKFRRFCWLLFGFLCDHYLTIFLLIFPSRCFFLASFFFLAVSRISLVVHFDFIFELVHITLELDGQTSNLFDASGTHSRRCIYAFEMGSVCNTIKNAALTIDF